MSSLRPSGVAPIEDQACFSSSSRPWRRCHQIHDVGRSGRQVEGLRASHSASRALPIASRSQTRSCGKASILERAPLNTPRR